MENLKVKKLSKKLERRGENERISEKCRAMGWKRGSFPSFENCKANLAISSGVARSSVVVIHHRS